MRTKKQIISLIPLAQYPQCLRWDCNTEPITMEDLLLKSAIVEAGINEEDIQKVLEYEGLIGEERTNQSTVNSLKLFVNEGRPTVTPKNFKKL